MIFRPHLSILLLCAFLLLGGCGKEDSNSGEGAAFGSGEIRWTSFPVELNLESDLYQDAEFQADLQEAVGFWETRAGKSLFLLKETTQSPHEAYAGSLEDPQAIYFNMILFFQPWPYAANVAGNTIVRSTGEQIEGGIILLNSETSLCGGDCSGLTGLSRRKLLAHELGHFLGLTHTPIRDDLMFPEILEGADLENLQVDMTTLDKLTR